MKTFGVGHPYDPATKAFGVLHPYGPTTKVFGLMHPYGLATKTYGVVRPCGPAMKATGIVSAVSLNNFKSRNKKNKSLCKCMPILAQTFKPSLSRQNKVSD